MIIGVQKAGTTALQTFLQHHPQVFMSQRKELHFFNRDQATDWTQPDYEDYEKNFAGAAPGQIKGEATPAYIFIPAAMERIHTYNPALRLIVVLRNPVDRAYSHWRMEKTRRTENLGFSAAIRQGRSRANFSKLHHTYVDRGFYAPQIRRLHSLFPPDRTLFLTTEDIGSSLPRSLKTCWEFLGCSAPESYPSEQVIRPLESGADLPEMSAEDRLYLQSLYEEDIAETSRLIGRDLSPWISGEGAAHQAHRSAQVG